jgi:poly(A) polymerase
MRNRLNRSLLHRARLAAHKGFEQEHAQSTQFIDASAITTHVLEDHEEGEHSDLAGALQSLRDATLCEPYEGALWLVGGYVRDTLLGASDDSLDDADLVTELDSLALAAYLYAQNVLDIAPVVYPRYGTALLRIHHCDIELVTARRESYDETSRKPANIEAASLSDDAFRRDFTINSLLENLHTGERLDPTGQGMSDIEKKILRTPLPPDRTFADDPLRMLRAMRFACKLGFTIDSRTWDAIIANASNLSPPKVSAERIRDEFCKTIMCRQPSHGLELLRKSGLLAQFAPELMATVGVTQNEFHNLPVWDHTLLALDNLVADTPECPLFFRLATLLHDIGKPPTKSVGSDGRIHFYAHEDIGAKLASNFLLRLKFSSSDINNIVQLVAMHMRIGEYKPSEWTDAAVRRLVRDSEGHLPELFALHSADVSALSGEHQDMSRAQQLRERIASLEQNQPSAAMDSPLTGDEIIAILGIAPGPGVGKWKQWLTDEVIEGRLYPADKSAAQKALIAKRNESIQ